MVCPKRKAEWGGARVPTSEAWGSSIASLCMWPAALAALSRESWLFEGTWVNSGMNKLNCLLPKRSLGCVGEKESSERERGRGSSKRDKREETQRARELKTELRPAHESSGFNSRRVRYGGALCRSLRKQMWLPVGGVGQASGRRWHFPCAS